MINLINTRIQWKSRHKNRIRKKGCETEFHQSITTGTVVLAWALTAIIKSRFFFRIHFFHSLFNSLHKFSFHV